jgi:hypothetical protein
MRLGSLIGAMVLLAGCPGGNGAVGDYCASHGDCAGTLQCMGNICVPRCERAPDCGDGFRCDESGLCIAATGQSGDTCKSEVDCAAGLSCQIEGTELDDEGHLLASCVNENSGRPAGAECHRDDDCRNGTCGLGHCIDLCRIDLDCGSGTICTRIPHPASSGILYRGCLQARGSVRWSIPMHSPNETIPLPVPATARSVSVLFTVDDPNQRVGATHITAPANIQILSPSSDYYGNQHVRHRPEYGESVLAMPISPGPASQLQTGVYSLNVRSERLSTAPTCTQPPCYIQGTATPKVTAVVKVDDAAILDLHFYFLNLDDHPCGDKFGGKLDATTAQSSTYFEHYLTEIKNILGTAVYFELGNVSFKDLRQHPDLDGLDVENAPSLLSLGEHATGINVFFVRTLSPIGLQAAGPNPGPAGLARTRRSGIIIGVDTLCYRDWRHLSRLTAYEVARYMGLYNNVGIETAHVDPISDSDSSAGNLMFYSELGGTFLSEGQKQILRRSAVLR